MSIRYATLLGAAVVAATLSLGAGGANADTVMQQCGAKWQAAKAAGTTGGQSWLPFLSQCRAELKGQPAAAAPAAPAAAAPAAAPAAPAAAAPAAVAPNPVAARPAPAPAAAGSAVFPSALNPAYASQSAGKARMHTCLDQYNVNKANGGNGGLKWIQKGGGYYSECNKRLKG